MAGRTGSVAITLRRDRETASAVYFRAMGEMHRAGEEHHALRPSYKSSTALL